MYRKGIYTIDQLRKRNIKDWFGKEKNISIILYQLLKESDLPERNELQEFVFYRVKFDNFYKRTYSNRFSDFDNLLLKTIISHFNKEYFEIHDLAASDGRTSIDLYKLFSKNLLNFNFLASDLICKVFVYKHPKNSMQICCGINHQLYEVDFYPFVFYTGRKEGKFYVINNLLKRLLVKEAKRYLVKITDKKEGIKSQQIEMIHPEVANLQEKQNNFSFINHDLFNATTKKFNVIRAMNILHQDYFSEQAIKQAINVIYQSMEMGGLFAIGSNLGANSMINGSIYKKTIDGFETIANMNGGCRVNSLIDSFRIKQLSDQL